MKFIFIVTLSVITDRQMWQQIPDTAAVTVSTIKMRLNTVWYQPHITETLVEQKQQLQHERSHYHKLTDAIRHLPPSICINCQHTIHLNTMLTWLLWRHNTWPSETCRLTLAGEAEGLGTVIGQDDDGDTLVDQWQLTAHWLTGRSFSGCHSVSFTATQCRGLMIYYQKMNFLVKHQTWSSSLQKCTYTWLLVFALTPCPLQHHCYSYIILVSSPVFLMATGEGWWFSSTVICSLSLVLPEPVTIQSMM